MILPESSHLLLIHSNLNDEKRAIEESDEKVRGRRNGGHKVESFYRFSECCTGCDEPLDPAIKAAELEGARK